MKLVKSIQNHLFVFYLLGQGTLAYRDKDMKNVRKKCYIDCIPACLFLIISVYVAAIAIAKQHAYSIYYDRTASVVTYFIILGAILTNVSVIFQTIFYRHNLKILLQKNHMILEYLKNKIKLNISLDLFKRKYLQKACIIYIFYFLTVLIKMYVDSRKISRSVQLCTLFMNGLKILTSIHVLFYIELFNIFLRLMHQQIFIDDDRFTDGFSFFNERKFAESLRHCKYVHFKLWEISRLINKCFGWILIMICLVNFIDASYAAFWVFLYIQEMFKTHCAIVIRKYYYYYLIIFKLF